MIIRTGDETPQEEAAIVQANRMEAVLKGIKYGRDKAAEQTADASREGGDQ